MKIDNKGEISLFVVVIVLVIIVVFSLVVFYAITGEFETPELFNKSPKTEISESAELSLEQIKEVFWELENDKALDDYLQGKIDNKEDFIETFKLVWKDRVSNSAIVFSGNDFDCAELITEFAKSRFSDGLPNPGLGKTYTVEVLIDLSRGTKSIQIKAY